MAARTKNLASKPGVVRDPAWRQRDAVWPIGAHQPFAAQRVPHGFIKQTGGMTAADDEFSDMEMIRVPPGKAPDSEFAFPGSGFSRLRHAHQGLQHRQCTELQRIQL